MSPSGWPCLRFMRKHQEVELLVGNALASPMLDRGSPTGAIASIHLESSIVSWSSHRSRIRQTRILHASCGIRCGPTLAPCSAPTVCLRVASPQPRDEGRNLGSVRSVGCTEVLGQETLFLSNLEHHANDKQPQPDHGGNRVPC